MTSQSVRLLLILVGFAVCLTVATSGEEAGNNEVLSGPVNNLMEDDLKFNIVKKEANPEARREKTQKHNGKNAGNKHNGKKAKENNGKPKRRNKNGGQKGRKSRVKARNGKGRKKHHTRGGKTKKHHTRGKNNKKHHTRGKKIKKHHTRGKNNKKHRTWGKNNKKPHTRGNKNRKPHTRGKNNKKHQDRGKKHQRGELRLNAGCTDNNAAQGISDSIFSFRKYFNHDKKITRTIKKATQLANKGDATKLVQFAEAAAQLKKVTKDGTECPANSALKNDVIAVIANLTSCGLEAVSQITLKCKTSTIGNFTALTAAETTCAAEYEPWIVDIQKCFNNPGSNPAGIEPKSCQCYLDMNTAPAISDDLPTSCKKPNVGGVDWISDFEAATTTALKACKDEFANCKALTVQAAKLTSECCANAETLTTGGTGRRLMRQAFLKSKLMNTNLH